MVLYLNIWLLFIDVYDVFIFAVGLFMNLWWNFQGPLHVFLLFKRVSIVMYVGQVIILGVG